MTNLSKDAVVLLDAARRAGPSASARERGKARLLAGLGAGSAATAASVVAKATLLGGSAGSGVAVSTVASALLVGMGLGVSVMVAAIRLTPSEPPRPVATQHAPRTATPAQVSSARAVASAAQRSDEPALLPNARKLTDNRGLPAADEGAPSLSRETAMLASAQKALGSGQAQVALETLEKYRVSFPEGALREEAAGARILALCELGRQSEGERERQAFLSAHPTSPLSARVSAACQIGSR
jgi:hypothetical protein